MANTEKEQGLTPAEKAARTRAAKAGNCASDGCGHPREEHDANLTTCWGDGPNCPCRGYTNPAAATTSDVDGG